VLTTAQAASTVPAKHIALTLAAYLTLYAALLVAYISVVFYLAKKPVQHSATASLKGAHHG
jgi:cytochrome d ubiquinol oxidase subunit I